MAKNLSPQQFAERWASGVNGSSNAYTQGVQGVSVAPGQLAAQAVNKYVQGIQDSVSQGRYQAGCQGVSLQSWQQSAIQKGAVRLSTSGTLGKAKALNFASKFLPALAQGVQQVQSMPSDSYEQRKARSGAMQDYLHSLKGKLK